MAQAKKLFRRMLLSNWGGIEHKILEFHEYVNLFSGKSGSGKSTFLNLVGGIENPTSGEVFFDGKSIHQFKDKELTKFRNQHIGYVFQQYHLLKELTVLENIRLPLDIGRKAYDHSYEEELLDLLGLKDRTDFYPSQLSGGQQQRVSIARALALKPKMLFFDEPTSALDPEITGEILKVIKDLAAEHMTMVIVTHEMKFARNVADRIIFMEKGRIVVQGTPEDVFSSENQRIQEFVGKLSLE